MFKRLLTLTLAAVCTLAASAEFRWGPTASVNFTDYRMKMHLIDVNRSIGGNGGILGELMFQGIGFGIDVGLQYSFHGAKFNLGQQPVWAVDGYGDEQVWLHSVQLPVHLRFKYTNLNGLEQKIAPFAFVGPNFSFCVADNKVEAFEYPAGSITIQFGAGVELWEHLQISGCYNLGVTYEVRTRKLDNFSGQQRSWQVGLAYLF